MVSFKTVGKKGTQTNSQKCSVSPVLCGAPCKFSKSTCLSIFKEMCISSQSLRNSRIGMFQHQRMDAQVKETLSEEGEKQPKQHIIQLGVAFPKTFPHSETICAERTSHPAQVCTAAVMSRKSTHHGYIHVYRNLLHSVCRKRETVTTLSKVACLLSSRLCNGGVRMSKL